MSDHKAGKLAINPAFFREVKEEHDELESLLGQLKQLCSGPTSPREVSSELRGLIQKLKNQLTLHFALEEGYGYFEEAIEVAPRLHRRAVRLRAQHRELTERVEQLAAQASDVSNDLTHLANQTLSLIHGLESHEAAERELIVSSCQHDIGGGD